MNAQTPITSGLALLRQPFPAHQISKLPKETRAQIDARKTDKSKMVWKCEVCGGPHHKDAVHLDYVGHAAATDRLLDADPEWSWEPLALDADGLPARDRNGGLWIKLTVCGVTRLGYGSADGKQGGDAVKELIGDAIRNAGMRFGMALDLWHKGDLHLEEPADEGAATGQSQSGEVSQSGPKPSRNWGGRYPTMTALKQAMHLHHAELERLGIEGRMDDLDNYLTSPEYQDYIATATEHAPAYLEGPIPESWQSRIPPEFIQTFKLEQKARDMIAIRGNVPA